MNQFKFALHFILLLILQNIIFAKQTIDETKINQQQSTEFPTPNLIAFSNSDFNKIDNYNLLTLVDTTDIQQNKLVYPPTKRNYKRLGYDTAVYLGTAVAAFCILWAMPESASNWNKEEIKEKGIFWKWKQNVKEGPIFDHDDFVLNYVTHPYSGAVYYMTARSNGFNIFESFFYSAFMSTCFWEYGIEAFAEVPSKQDLIVTPVLGSVLGEGFFYAKKSILKNNRRVLKSKILGYSTLFLIDPFNTLLDGFGYKVKTKGQLSVAPVGFDKVADKPIWGLNFNIQF